MDDFRIYDTALSESDVISLHSAPPHEVSPAPADPSYNAFINSLRRLCAGHVLGNIPLHHILDTIPMQHDDLILEFGVWMGHSLNRIARAYPQAHVFGFDSFYGLPEDWSYPWVKGSFNVQGRLPQGLPDNVELVAGWFNESLPFFVKSQQWKAALKRHKLSRSKHSPGANAMKNAAQIALLHVDCDLYSSTMTVFNALDEYILPGTIIVFDELMNFRDYEKQEMRALYEYVTRRKLQFEVIGVQCVGVCQHVAIKIV